MTSADLGELEVLAELIGGEWAAGLGDRVHALLGIQRPGKVAWDRAVRVGYAPYRAAHDAETRTVGGYERIANCRCDPCRQRRVVVDLAHAWRRHRARTHPRNIKRKLGLKNTPAGTCRLCADPVARGLANRPRWWHDGRAQEPDCLGRFLAATRLSTHGLWWCRKRDGDGCRACGSAVGPFEVDHVIALVDGGSPWPENLQVLCRACHKDKTAREATARARRRRA